MTAPHPEHPEASTPDARSATASRRIALRTLLAGGGAAAGALAIGRPASALATPVNIGETNTTTLPTIIGYTGDPISAGPSVFSAGGGAPDGDSPFPAGVGGYGDGTVPHGIHGSTTNPAGFGVVAANLGELPDDEAQAPGALAVASAAGPQIVFVALEGAVEGPTPGTHVAGELYRDAAGTLWFTVPAPTEDDPLAIEFVKLAGSPEPPVDSGSAGEFFIINPQRVYDSRQAGYEVRGLLEPNQSRVISVADGRDGGGLVTTPDAVPEGATAVLINLTVDAPTGGNFLQVTDGDTTSTETSVLNWSPGTVQLANSITVPVNAAREIRVYCGNQSGSTHVLVDVFGYYL